MTTVRDQFLFDVGSVFYVMDVNLFSTEINSCSQGEIFNSSVCLPSTAGISFICSIPPSFSLHHGITFQVFSSPFHWSMWNIRAMVASTLLQDLLRAANVQVDQCSAPPMSASRLAPFVPLESMLSPTAMDPSLVCIAEQDRHPMMGGTATLVSQARFLKRE